DRRRPHRHAARDRLAEAHDVGRDVVVLAREPAPRASDAGLHLVDDEERVALVAELTESAHVLARRGPHAALALNHLYEDRRGLARDRAVDRVDVVER